MSFQAAHTAEEFHEAMDRVAEQTGVRRLVALDPAGKLGGGYEPLKPDARRKLDAQIRSDPATGQRECCRCGSMKYATAQQLIAHEMIQR